MDSICSVKSLSEYIAVIEDNQLFNYISRGENRFYETPLSSGIQRRKLRNYQELLNSFSNRPFTGTKFSSICTTPWYAD